MTKDEFMKCMTLLSMAYNKPLTSGQPEVWWEFFRDVELSRFEAGISKTIDTTDHWPTVATIKKNMPPKKSQYHPGTSIMTAAATDRYLEDLYSCALHRANPAAEVTPDTFVGWCKPCQRFRNKCIAAAKAQKQLEGAS